MKMNLEARQARLKAEKKAHNNVKGQGKVETKSSVNGEDRNQKSKLQNMESVVKGSLKVGSKLNGKLV
jgi:hypothetical protein